MASLYQTFVVVPITTLPPLERRSFVMENMRLVLPPAPTIATCSLVPKPKAVIKSLTDFSTNGAYYPDLFPYFFLRTRVSPTLTVTWVRSKYSIRGIVYFRETPVISLN